MSLLSGLVSSSLVFAASLGSTPDPQTIAGGQPVEPCGWQSVVLLRGNGYLCTGNLIHPQIVATAAHCLASMGDDTEVFFGDTANSAQDKVAVDFCMGSPDYVDSEDGTIPFSEVRHDWGFCKLAAPVTDVQPIPPIYGCETDLLQPGAEIVRVGFGKETLATNVFYKREVTTQIVSIPYDDANGWPAQLSEGGGGQGTCPGDSGGPAFIRVPESAGGDGSWRMIAIQSTQPIETGDGEPIECGTEPNNTAVIAQGIEFIEAQSGIDVTPCHDADGSWNPSFDCSAFPLDPMAGGGFWPNSCDQASVGGFGETCGAAFDALHPDTAGPLVAIVEPAGPVEQEYPGDSVSIHVRVDANDGDGWGVSRVELRILDASSGDELAMFEDATADYEWDPSFPKGEFLIQATAYDNAGFVTETDTLPITIGIDPPPAGTSGGDDGTSDGGSSSDGDDGGGDSGGDAGDGPDEDDEDEGADTDGAGAGQATGGDDEGCACTSAPGGGTAGGLWLLAVGAVLRRRRRE